jgi:hypothetical protein
MLRHFWHKECIIYSVVNDGNQREKENTMKTCGACGEESETLVEGMCAACVDAWAEVEIVDDPREEWRNHLGAMDSFVVA